jgi:uridine kinase
MGNSIPFQGFVEITSSLRPPEFVAQYITREKIIGITGASASGKTTFARELHMSLGGHTSAVVNVDDYWCYTRQEMKEKNLTGYDWASRDKERLLRDIQTLRAGIAVEKPIHDYLHERPSSHTEILEPKDILILEATLDFTDIADLFVFVYASEDVLFKRRIERDRNKANFDESALGDYVRTKSLPAYRKNILPLADKADVIINTESQTVFRRVQ